MRRAAIPCGAVVAAVWLSGAMVLAGGPVVVDRILVVVNGQPILQSRVALYRAYLEATNGAGLGWPGRIEGAASMSDEELLEIVIKDELLFEGASQMELIAVREKALQERLGLFKKGFDSEEAYEAFVRTHDWTLDLMREFFGRRVRIEGYIGFKVGIRMPSEKELLEHYEANIDAFAGRTFEASREEISRRLVRARSLNEFDEWTAKLSARTVVQAPSRAIER